MSYDPLGNGRRLLRNSVRIAVVLACCALVSASAVAPPVTGSRVIQGWEAVTEMGQRLERVVDEIHAGGYLDDAGHQAFRNFMAPGLKPEERASFKDEAMQRFNASLSSATSTEEQTRRTLADFESFPAFMEWWDEIRGPLGLPPSPALVNETTVEHIIRTADSDQWRTPTFGTCAVQPAAPMVTCDRGCVADCALLFGLCMLACFLALAGACVFGGPFACAAALLLYAVCILACLTGLCLCLDSCEGCECCINCRIQPKQVRWMSMKRG